MSVREFPPFGGGGTVTPVKPLRHLKISGGVGAVCADLEVRTRTRGADRCTDWWRTWARRAQATLEVAVALHSGTIGDESTWRIVCDTEGLPTTGFSAWQRPRGVDDGWNRLDYMLGYWLRAADVRPALERRDRKPVLTWGSEHHPVFGTVALRLRLLERAKASPTDAHPFAGLVLACRYCGLLEASLAAHERAQRIDPHVPTAVMFTLYAMGRYQEVVERAQGFDRSLRLDCLILFGGGLASAAAPRIRTRDGRPWSSPVHAAGSPEFDGRDGQVKQDEEDSSHRPESVGHTVGAGQRCLGPGFSERIGNSRPTRLSHAG